MNQEPSLAPMPPKTAWPVAKITAILIVVLIAGIATGYFVRESSFKSLQGEVAQLKKDIADLQTKTSESISPSPSPSQTTQIKYVYGINFPVSKSLGDLRDSEAIIPLGATGNYTVKSRLFSSDLNPNITILVSTDAIVYENFIRAGTQAITPNPNILTPGSPLIMNGVAFCPALVAKSCVYDETTNSAVFEKEYKDSKNNPYTVWGSIRFFPVSPNDIGKTAAVIITRITSNNQQLLDWAKEIAVNSKK